MSIDKLGKTLEDQFFAALEVEKLDGQARHARAAQQREDLARASGLLDTNVLDTLSAAGVTPDVVTALGLVPLVWAAWASGVVEPAQHAAVVESSRQVGVVPESSADLLLRCWLAQRPTSDLFTAWRDYALGLRAIMNEPEWRAMGAVIVGRARTVASAAGGILGLFEVSRAEARVLDQLDAVFTS